MEGFKANPKMKCDLPCFKEGGFVTKKAMKKEEKAEEKKDLAVDKKIAKKAISQHESAQHKGEPKTELKLKKGGRSKKEAGTVKRFDSKAIGMKKDKSDKKAIAKTKKMKPVVETTTMVEEIAPAPAPAPAPMSMASEEMPMFSDGSSVNDAPKKRYAYGEVNGMPVNEQQMKAAEARMRSSSNAFDAQNSDLTDFANKARADIERKNLMKGLQAVGQYCSGGKAY